MRKTLRLQAVSAIPYLRHLYDDGTSKLASISSINQHIYWMFSLSPVWLKNTLFWKLALLPLSGSIKPNLLSPLGAPNRYPWSSDSVQLHLMVLTE